MPRKKRPPPLNPEQLAELWHAAEHPGRQHPDGTSMCWQCCESCEKTSPHHDAALRFICSPGSEERQPTG